jgi:outer membrane protein OmpA-like peptidoglycan-associated protein
MRISNPQLLRASLMLALAGVLYAATPATRQIEAGAKTTIRGTIVSRRGDLIRVREKKSGDSVIVELFEDTKFERRKGKFEFFRHVNMDATVMVPGLTIEAAGVGTVNGHLDARKIAFTPDVFAIEVAEERQIMANEAAAQKSQSTANQGVASAEEARVSANQAQLSADAAGEAAGRAQHRAQQADADAQSAGELAVMDAAALQAINSRVSDLDNYETVAETTIFFGNGRTELDDVARQKLNELAAAATSLDGYMIEIAGYASNPGARKLNQKLSEGRAAAVAQYLREKKDVPMRRILAPAGYGATHLFATAADPQDRPLDRSVDVKVLLNKAFDPSE